MKELIIDKSVDILQVPNGDELWGIALPYVGGVSKDGLGMTDNLETRNVFRFLKLNRKLGEYITKWGNRTYYLGTFANPANAKFCVFGFPVKYNYKAESDMTLITKSCEDLDALCRKRGIKRCLLPMFAEDLGMSFFKNSMRDTLDLVLDDKFIMLHRNGGIND